MATATVHPHLAERHSTGAPADLVFNLPPLRPSSPRQDVTDRELEIP
jgi:hypothetical protein